LTYNLINQTNLPQKIEVEKINQKVAHPPLICGIQTIGHMFGLLFGLKIFRLILNQIDFPLQVTGNSINKQ